MKTIYSHKNKYGHELEVGKFDHESVDEYFVYIDGDDQVEFDYISPDAAESLALALLDDLGKGWKPYPENKPISNDPQLVTAVVHGKVIVGYTAFVHGGWLGWDNSSILAYRELPAPFQPEEQ